MRNDVKETIRRSLEIEKQAEAVPKKLRQKTIKTWLEENNWDTNTVSLQEIDEMSLFEKITMSRLLLKQIVKYGYAWLPDTLKESGKRIATTTPVLITLNMLVRISLIPILFTSNLPESPSFSFALYSIVTAVVHENEVRILKKAPVVVNQYVSTLSFFFPPRIASLLFRAPTYILNAVLLLRPTEADKAVSAYFCYALLWFAIVEGLGATAMYTLVDQNGTQENDGGT